MTEAHPSGSVTGTLAAERVVLYTDCRGRHCGSLGRVDDPWDEAHAHEVTVHSKLKLTEMQGCCRR